MLSSSHIFQNPNSSGSLNGNPDILFCLNSVNITKILLSIPMLNGQRKHVSAPKRGRETFPCSFCFSVDQQCRSAVGRSYSKTQILREVKMAIQAFCSVSFRFRRTRSFSRRLQSSVFLKQPYHHFFPYPSLEFAFPSFFSFIFPFLY